MSLSHDLFPDAGAHLWAFAWPRGLAWTALVAAFALLGLYAANLEQRRMALAQAQAAYAKDLAYGHWTSERGGEPGFATKLTGEKPRRPEHAPDGWEMRALQQVESTGAKEVWEIRAFNGQPHLRYLGALRVTASCLDCHRGQGYEVGQVKGGLSVAVPLQPLTKLGTFPGVQAMAAGLLGLWLAGLAGLFAWGHHWRSLSRLKAAREADRIGAEQYRAILQTSVDGFLHLDPSGRILDVNEGYLRLSGYTRKELLGLRIQALDAELRGNDTAEFHRRDLAHQGERRVTHHRARDGRIWTVELSLSPVPGAGTWVALLRDVTREHQARMALEESEHRLLNAQRIAHIGFWERDLDSDHVICSRETFRILDIDPTPDLTVPLEEVQAFIHPEDLDCLEGMYEKVWTGGKPFQGEFRILRPDGSLRYIETQAEVFLSRGGMGLRIIRTLFDITERREAEQEKRRLEQEVQQTQKLDSLGSLAGGVAHDMNNVLGAIYMVASGLQEQRAEDAPLRKAMDLVMSAAGRGRDLVRSLTEFARKGVDEPTHVNLNALVGREVELLRRTTLNRIELVEDVAPDVPSVLGDPSSLANALMNLCVNAVDAMPDGGQLRLTTRALPDGRAELRVEDTGLGMSPEVLQRATEPFFTTKPQGKGTGLGLAMVYGVAKAHGGVLDIQSRQGEGTRITLRFPGVTSLPASEGRSKQDLPACRPLRVLLVDDDDLIRASVPSMMEGLGHAVEAVASGAEALQRLERREPFDVVILDMNMPGLSGLETLAGLRLLDPDLPVVISSGFLDGEVEAMLLGDPRVAFLPKPYTLGDLRRRLLDRRPGGNRGPAEGADSLSDQPTLPV